MSDRKLGLSQPPKGFVSLCPPLLGAGSPVALLDWDTIRAVASGGLLDGRKIYGSKFVCYQKHNNCAGASSSRIVAKSIYDHSRAIVPLSETYTYSLINGGRDNGSMLTDAMQSIETDGVCTTQSCGPDDIFRRQYKTERADTEARRFRVRECYALRDSSDIDTVKRSFWTALCIGFKVGVALQVGSRFDSVSPEGTCGVDAGPGNHAVHCDGIALVGGEIVATAENSWGKSWGQQGRMLLTWAHFAQTIGVHEFYAARTAIDDPQSDNPCEVKL